MNRHHVKHFLICLLVIAMFASPVFSQSYSSKLDYYNNVLVPTRGLKPLPSGQLEAYKPGSFLDRKKALLDVGNVIVLISNGATLGYDRWGLCWEYPAKSTFTYRWCMAPLMGGNINGSYSVASGTRGAARKSEEEFQPLPGYDSGVDDESQNIGVALSDIPAGWPTTWPTGPYEAPIGDKGFKGVSWLPGNEGNIVATREAYFATVDDDPTDGNLPNPMHIRVDVWGLQWDDFINQDFIIFRMKVTNIGTTPVEEFIMGVHDDPDTPEQGSQEWTDDFASFIAPGDDVENYSDKEDSLLWNFSYLWDGDDRVQGFIASDVPWVGLKVLETPEDPANPGSELGLTTLDIFEYSQAPQTELGEYEQLDGASHVASPDDTDGIMSPTNITPHPEDWTQSTNTFGPDITYVVGSGPFHLGVGENLTFSLASIHAANKSSLLLNAMRCQTLWNASLLASEGPPQPILNYVAGDGKVQLYWGMDSEDGIYADGHIGDKQTGSTDKFQGYKVYKSLDRGASWGTEITDVNGGLQGYIPIAIYDKPDGINGESSTRRYFMLGTDSGLRHYYIDQNVSNGYEYYYAVTGFDSDDGAVPPLENSRKTNPAYSDVDNTISVIPQRPPTGTTVPAVTITKTAGTSDVLAADVDVMIVDDSAVTGHTYNVVFDVTGGVTTFAVQDVTAGNTVVNDVYSSAPLTGNGFYDADEDNAVIFDGIRMEIQDVAAEVVSITSDAALFGDEAAGWEMDEYDMWADLTHDVTITFTDASTETYLAASIWGIIGYAEPDIQVNFKVMDTTEGVQLTPIFYDRGSYNLYWDWEGSDRLIIQQGAYYATFTSQDDFGGDYNGLVLGTESYGSEPLPGDVVTIITKHVLTESDVFAIATTSQNQGQVTRADLEDIQAVPNPFVVSSRFETGAYGFQKELQFHQLPTSCTIRIYNIAGDFIDELVHSGGSIEAWDLQSYNDQEIAYGIYFFHVNAPGIGEHIGKFAIIK